MKRRSVLIRDAGNCVPTRRGEPTRLGYRSVGAAFQRGAAIYCWIAFLAGATGQELLAPPPSEFRQQVYTPDNQFQPLAQNNAAPPGPEFQTPLRWGPFEVHGHLLYRLLYTDGLQAQPGQRSQTAINEISPRVLLDLGPHWRVDYTPSLRFYSNSRFRDTTDQSVLVEGGTSMRTGLSGCRNIMAPGPRHWSKRPARRTRRPTRRPSAPAANSEPVCLWN